MLSSAASVALLAAGVATATGLAMRGLYWTIPLPILAVAAPIYLANRGRAATSVLADFADRRVLIRNVVKYSWLRPARCREVAIAFDAIRWMEICPARDRGTFRSVCIATDEGVYSIVARGTEFLGLMERLQAECGSRMTRPRISMELLHLLAVALVATMVGIALAIVASYP